MKFTIRESKIENWGYEITAPGFHNIAPTVEAAVNYLKDRYGSGVEYHIAKPRRMRFGTWCRKDQEDTRKINYELTREDGEVEHFTSEDEMPFYYMELLRYAWIRSIELRNGEWYACLYVE